jgi:hypothetical protein
MRREKNEERDREKHRREKEHTQTPSTIVKERKKDRLGTQHTQSPPYTIPRFDKPYALPALEHLDTCDSHRLKSG